MSITVLADENIPAVERFFGDAASVQRTDGRALHRDLLQDIDVLLVRSVTRVDEALLQGSPVQFVGTATSGVDHIDREYLARSNIGFTHAPGSNANSVVEYVLAAVAAVDGKLEQLLAGGSVGVIGHGVIGKAVASCFEALGIHYYVYDPWLASSAIRNGATLETVLDCDVVSLHAELTQQQPWPSYHLLTLPELQRLRPEALLVNASRGAVVDNKALLKYLETSRAASVVLDVWEGEPDIDIALLQRVTLGTAHIAGYSLDGKLLATRMLADAAIEYLGLLAPLQRGMAEKNVVLDVPQSLTGAALVRHLVCSHYEISMDDALLRQAMARSQGSSARSVSFDLLRKSYRARRELAGAAVAGVSLPEDMALVRALGCNPVKKEAST